MTQLRKRTITAYSDEENARAAKAEADAQELQRAYVARLSPFIREFRKVLTAEQMTAIEALMHAMEIVAAAGNASSAYDGVPAPPSFTAKSYSARTLDAQGLVRLCRHDVARAIGNRQVGAWSLFLAAIENGWTPQQSGDEYARRLRLHEGRDKRREKAIAVISDVADIVVATVNEWRQR